MSGCVTIRLATLAMAVLAGFPAALLAQQATALDRFLEGLTSWQTQFTQTVTDSRGRTRPGESGQLIVQRPGRFRWEIGNAQLMVADGRNLWFLDRDLEQVTVKPASRALTATPATLLAGTAPLRNQFRLESEGRRDNLDWVRVTPLSSSAEFRSARLGFAGLELARMELLDALGQRVTLAFTASRRNAPVDPAALTFKPPAGADVIGTPLE
ncbi:MAG: outer membrane lipoprotein chaperone LolA [Steroidobacteraceae bacterium]